TLGHDILTGRDAIKREVGYMTQRFSYYEDLSIRENLEFVVRLYEMDRRVERVDQALERLGLVSRQHQLAGSLSGGEQARVALAMIMLSGANLLLFDEPTNHLDVESIEALEDAIEAFDGTVLLVSHDRALLRALTTRVWVLHDGHITDYPGGFEAWEAASAERAHAAAVAAAEEESLRRVRDRKQTRRPEDNRKREQSAKRTAERELAAAETEVARCEARLAGITAQLEDPELYVHRESAPRSEALGRELEAARAALDRALARWESLATR
ncbi:MAG: ATP-binding cassette domain-containing protein, partial [Myxococcota bacterium]